MKNKTVTLPKQMTAVALFFIIVFGGLFFPTVFNIPQYSQTVENVMIMAAIVVSVFILLTTDKTWDEIFQSGMQSIKNVAPGTIILLVIGPLIGSFIMSGLIPMLIYYAIKLIHPQYIYVMSLLLPVLFSGLTGASWGAGATIGIVMMGIGTALGANLGIVAGAVIGGCYFGDKISPISATTNIAAIACDVDLYDHVGSMLWTTIPSTLLGVVFYTICGFMFPATHSNLNTPEISALLADLSGMFNFNILLLIPVVIVVWGAIKKIHCVPVLIVATCVASLFSLIFQGFTFDQVLKCFNSGFTLSMVNWYEYSQPIDGEVYILGYFQRGGFHSFSTLVAIQWTILFAVGVLGSINAMPATVSKIFSGVKSRTATMISATITGIGLIGITANGSACSFIQGQIFGPKFDEKGIDRRVLSRIAEDTGTVLEVLMPWTPSGLFFITTLGVPASEYGIWAIVNYSTPIFGVILAITGIGTYRNQLKVKTEARVETA
ncbi:MAG: sodium:proton antiporter [Epulopiscium sp. Nele67-Bin002]|nr:MAG: sodium:proton antiporter [Epulopiscium sp. Nele67-Bin001]OON92690.1 MAG: sodium:proton antiporter [Epulopiscium sp. Nele67-Bin002]